MDKTLIAHVKQSENGEWLEPHWLSDHLMGTANYAQEFARKFNSAAWGRISGYAHDIGKGRDPWQRYLIIKSGYDEEAHLEEKAGKKPHAIHGAKMAEEVFGKGIGRILAYCIAGHHAGLPDWSCAEGEGQAALQYQLSQVKNLSDIDPTITEVLQDSPPPPLPWGFADGLDMSLWIRMLYSCLVDADFLDTERYMNINNAKLRGSYCTIDELLQRFNQFSEKMDRTSEDTPVNQIRRKIRDKCIAMARKEPQGIFTLSVPTGGGKTLSGLAFGLEHAKAQNLERIIYVIPYTSIIEQNADVFRSVLGDDQVVEHHSSLDEEDSTPKSRLASENWDAPVIVTTSVQFFESLFAAKSSRCRKLHNISKSVVILDEAQLIPVQFLTPILETLQLLVEHYHVSLVISTATQPALNQRVIDGKRFKGFLGVRELMGNEQEVKTLYDSLKRYRVQLPEDFHVASSWENIAQELKEYNQVLCVVSDRTSCRELHGLMPEGTYHLSALMCGQHRSEVIAEIKDKLKNGEVVRVISTQLVEAGVDLDFPVVYRALAGLDSIAQAGGRCNREGKLTNLGKVVVFIPPKQAPLGILRKAADAAQGILMERPDNPMALRLFDRFFDQVYSKANSLDQNDIVSLLSKDCREGSISFRTAAAKFRLIDDTFQKTVLVRYGEGDRLIDMVKNIGPERWLMRKLQRYTVNIPNTDFERMIQRGAIEAVYPGIFALTSPLDYSKEVGLLVEQTLYDHEQLIYP